MPEGLRPVIVSVEDEPASSWFSHAWPAVVMVATVLIGLALSTLANSGPSLPPAPTPAPWPGTVSTAVPAAHAQISRRALLILLPGARSDYLRTYITDGTMHNLALLAAGGVVPEYVTPVEPAITALNLESLVRGSRPRLAGLFSGTELPALFTAPAVWAWDGQSEQTDAVLFWPDAEPGGADADIFVTLADGSSAGRPDALPLHTTPAGLAPALIAALGQPPAAVPASADDFAERVYRRLDWQARAGVWVWSSCSPRTMVIVFDALTLLAEAGRLNGEDVYDSLTRTAYRRLDGALGTLFSAVDMAQTAAVVGTTNGALPYQRVLNLEAVLRAGAPAVPPDAVRIITAGGTALISIRPPADNPPAVQAAYIEGVQEALERAAAGDQPALQRVAAGDSARQM
ncbi:MAG: alkaline phosphatase family protein, partial [Anaerolineae bacterium]